MCINISYIHIYILYICIYIHISSHTSLDQFILGLDIFPWINNPTPFAGGRLPGKQRLWCMRVFVWLAKTTWERHKHLVGCTQILAAVFFLKFFLVLQSFSICPEVGYLSHVDEFPIHEWTYISCRKNPSWMDIYGLYDLLSLHLRQLKVNNINTPKCQGIHPGKQTSGTWKSSIWKGETSSKPFIFGF